MNPTVLSLKLPPPYGPALAKINRDLDTLVKYSKTTFDCGVKDTVVTQLELEILEQTYLQLRAAQQGIEELWLESKEHFKDTKY